MKVVEDVPVIRGGLAGVNAGLSGGAGGGDPFVVEAAGRGAEVLDLARGETAEGEPGVSALEVMTDGDATDDGETDTSDKVETQMGDVWEVCKSVFPFFPTCLERNIVRGNNEPMVKR